MLLWLLQFFVCFVIVFDDDNNDGEDDNDLA